jgi:hypothetical protein
VKFVTVILFLFVNFNIVLSQDKTRAVSFNASINGEKLQLDHNYAFGDDSISFSNLKFYISDIQFYRDDVFIRSLVKKNHLIDFSQPSKQYILLDSISNVYYNRIEFNLGTDSLDNVSGAMSDDLDPIHGMYWTWQSGYINFKLEGSSKVCPSRNHEFNFHIGGYLYPFTSMQRLVFEVNQSSDLSFNLDLSKLISIHHLQKEYNIMSPSEKSLLFSKRIVVCINLSK